LRETERVKGFRGCSELGLWLRHQHSYLQSPGVPSAANYCSPPSFLKRAGVSGMCGGFNSDKTVASSAAYSHRRRHRHRLPLPLSRLRVGEGLAFRDLEKQRRGREGELRQSGFRGLGHGRVKLSTHPFCLFYFRFFLLFFCCYLFYFKMK